MSDKPDVKMVPIMDVTAAKAQAWKAMIRAARQACEKDSEEVEDIVKLEREIRRVFRRGKGAVRVAATT